MPSAPCLFYTGCSLSHSSPLFPPHYTRWHNVSLISHITTLLSAARRQFCQPFLGIAAFQFFYAHRLTCALILPSCMSPVYRTSTPHLASLVLGYLPPPSGRLQVCSLPASPCSWRCTLKPSNLLLLTILACPCVSLASRPLSTMVLGFLYLFALLGLHGSHVPGFPLLHSAHLCHNVFGYHPLPARSLRIPPCVSGCGGLSSGLVFGD